MVGVDSVFVRVDWEVDWGAMDSMLCLIVLEVTRISQHCQKGVMVYCNLPALGRDLAHTIITQPLSDTCACSLMSAAAYTASGFTQ